MTIPVSAEPARFCSPAQGPSPSARAHRRAQVDVLIGEDGLIRSVGSLRWRRPQGVRRIECAGSYLSPGWVDLHVHVWHGGTDISIRPSLCGVERGVTTVVDAGLGRRGQFPRLPANSSSSRRASASSAFLNIGSIGLVACNRVSELIDIRSIDLDRTIACVEAEPGRHRRHQGARQPRHPRVLGHHAGQASPRSSSRF